MKVSIDSDEQEHFVQHIRCCLVPVREKKHPYWYHRLSLRFSIVDKKIIYIFIKG